MPASKPIKISASQAPNVGRRGAQESEPLKDSAEKPVDRRRTNMREQIEQVATELFFQHGFEATSVRMIADVCGITPAALYNHFETKEELLFHIIQSAGKIGAAVMSDSIAAAPPDPCNQLKAAARAFVRLYTEHRLVGLVASSEYKSLSEPWLSEVKKTRLGARALFEQIILAGQRSGDFQLIEAPGVAAVRLVSVAMGDMCIRVAEWFDPNGSLSADAIADAYAEMCLRLVGAKPQSGRARESRAGHRTGVKK